MFRTNADFRPNWRGFEPRPSSKLGKQGALDSARHPGATRDVGGEHCHGLATDPRLSCGGGAVGTQVVDSSDVPLELLEERDCEPSHSGPHNVDMFSTRSFHVGLNSSGFQ